MRLSTVFALFFAAVAIAAPSDDVNDHEGEALRCRYRGRYDYCVRVRQTIFTTMKGSRLQAFNHINHFINTELPS